LLLEEAKTDPIKRAGLISDIVRSIAVIPDSITRSVYIKECSRLLDIQENVLYTEIVSQRKKKMEQIMGRVHQETEVKPTPPLPGFISDVFCEEQEKEIVYFMLRFGSVVFWEPEQEDEIKEKVTVGQYIINEIQNDDLEFKNLVYQKIFNEYRSQLEINPDVDSRYFVNHPDSQISQIAVDFLSTPHKLSKIWIKHQAFDEDEAEFLHKAAPKAIIVFKSKVMQIAIKRLHEELKNMNSTTPVNEINELLTRIKTLNSIQNTLSKDLERIVL
jgi:DNA primase